MAETAGSGLTAIELDEYSRLSQLYFPVAIWTEVSFNSSLFQARARLTLFLLRPFSMVGFTTTRHNRCVSDALSTGVYACLFIATTRIMLKKQAAESFASRVFLVAGSINFALGTLHICKWADFYYGDWKAQALLVAFALYRLVRAYALLIVPPHPILYLFDFNRWDNFSHLVILALMTWIADGLVVSLL